MSGSEAGVNIEEDDIPMKDDGSDDEMDDAQEQSDEEGNENEDDSEDELQEDIYGRTINRYPAVCYLHLHSFCSAL
ncbi:hypothetical protein ANCDUO_23836 [Ancylostoma duodenale]|uniref:Uncharacterized protein n=1 Tax=Ancylostoma duodenale TaxID=51022 RepID=A0A0C2FH84_9BILA|nr:hypothetical protein ANCDUO_23836 [Ancylostoma duodenale]